MTAEELEASSEPSSCSSPARHPVRALRVADAIWEPARAVSQRVHIPLSLVMRRALVSFVRRFGSVEEAQAAKRAGGSRG